MNEDLKERRNLIKHFQSVSIFYPTKMVPGKYLKRPPPVSGSPGLNYQVDPLLDVWVRNGWGLNRPVFCLRCFLPKVKRLQLFFSNQGMIGNNVLQSQSNWIRWDVVAKVKQFFNVPLLREIIATRWMPPRGAPNAGWGWFWMACWNTSYTHSEHIGIIKSSLWYLMIYYRTLEDPVFMVPNCDAAFGRCPPNE